jgi:4-diphosphocytidyl-2-C-methyl-D-erythritol kinase
MTDAPAFAKINLALVVGPLREDGKHEVVTVLQRIDLHDTITLTAADEIVVDGFAEDTIVTRALATLAARSAGAKPGWHVHIDKGIPLAAGLGGGSSDAATALALANGTLEEPLPTDELHRLASGVGSDVPFFLYSGAKLATGDGTELASVDLPIEYVVVLVVPHGATKDSSGAVYAEFDARAGAAGFDARAAGLHDALGAVTAPLDLGALPPNDLASSPLVHELEALGAFRADVSGAGPTVYGLFTTEAEAESAVGRLASLGRTFVARPVPARRHA